MIFKVNYRQNIFEFFTRKDRSLNDEELKFFEESATVEAFKPTFDRNDRAKIAAMWIGGLTND